MTSKQYEELCRLFLAHQLGCDLTHIASLNLDHAARAGQAEFCHQIDLCWQVEDDLGKFVLIANAKWHKESLPVDLKDVLLIQKVREALSAHKAVLLTNTSFTAGARAAAAHEGVALHVVRPIFDWSRLHLNDPSVICSQLQSLALQRGQQSLFVHEVVHKGLGLGRSEAANLPPREQPPASPRTAGAVGAGPQSYPTKSLTGGGTQAAPSSRSAPSPRPSHGGNFPYRTK